MIGTSAVLQAESSDEYVISKPPLYKHKIEPGLLALTDLELSVTDLETGKPISMAMISIDSIGRTAVCNDQGKVLLKGVSSGRLLVDVIICGYIANSTMVYTSAKQFHTLNVKMIRNC